ncbi:Hydroxymethylpyrimidine pyrophosphatase [Abditibacterium utsteinense]|uniref:Hydroxymethylpyrimidine pyrophosphatase n=1 Tax=Abditibacterium utsteinense TaxID=1960156 RepID=A0A2S8SQ72_9BACT|nr:hypothetical protein [Abditibacterium utsteinense]PQV62950.1 Hydroxymethylpyrimidine pyrophosphatase [Abditibacterium utsteinense]
MTSTSRRALILDLDFTLLHLEFVRGAIEVPGRTRSAWVAPRTVETLSDLQAKFDLVLATARSYDGTKWVVDGLQNRGVEVAALVLEDGARFGTPQNLCAFEPGFNAENWRAKLEKANQGGPLFEWQLDFENCLVARCENGEMSEILRQKWTGAEGGESATLRFFRDGRKVYALPARANKWSALQRLLGAKAQLAAGVGDGENDLVWLPRVANPATFARAKPALVEAVRVKNGFVSNLDGHEGIADILRRWL